LVAQKDLRNILKHCILVLSAAPNQLQAVMQELQEMGADDLLSTVIDELHVQLPTELNPHISQHKDHAHKKLRSCLQQKSSNLTVQVAVRLTMYTERTADKTLYVTDVQALAQDDLSLEDVRKGLQGLVHEHMLDWQGDDTVHVTSAQLKRLMRFYKDDEEE
jgi:predicted nucleotidyltransferase